MQQCRCWHPFRRVLPCSSASPAQGCRLLHFWQAIYDRARLPAISPPFTLQGEQHQGDNLA